MICDQSLPMMFIIVMNMQGLVSIHNSLANEMPVLKFAYEIAMGNKFSLWEFPQELWEWDRN